MPTPPMTPEQLREATEAIAKHGSISAAAKALGLSRSGLQRRVRVADARGVLPEPRKSPNVARWRPFDQVRAARIQEFERVAAAGDGRTLHVVPLKDDGPFLLAALGDPHLDAPGTCLKSWERWNGMLDARAGRYGLCVGDYLDNWVRVLGHLYGQAQTAAPEGWVLLEGYLERYARHWIGSVSGNHDDWSGYTDLLGRIMREHGVTHRAKSLRLSLTLPDGRVISVGMRHRFSGSSQWNPAHAVMKAARMGWRDTILVGGDKHISGDGLVKDPDTGKLTWCYQLAAFKRIDDYGDDLGLMDQHVSPAVAFVVDPARGDNDPQLVTPFHEPEAAADYLAHLRRRTPCRKKPNRKGS